MSFTTTLAAGEHKIECPTGLFINNEWVAAKDGGKIDVVNPSNEKVICAVEEATEKDVDIAVKAARKAFESSEWSDMTPQDRGKLMTTLAELMERDAKTLSALESLDNGKPFSIASMADIPAAYSTIRYYAGWADKIQGTTDDINKDTFAYTRVEPIGVCGQIIPWNFPLLMFAWKIGPALATGNTIVLKPAEQTPLTALYMTKLIKEAGFPPGVLNVIPGYGKTAGAAISSHMDVDKVAFTGSTLVGRTIMQAAAKSNLKKVTLELGGKSPNIIFNDADIDSAVSWSNAGVFLNAGQVCCAGTRIYVQEGIYDKFVEKFKARIAQNHVGDAFDAKSFQGPQVSKLQFDRVMAYIKDGKSEGAKVEVGGERLGENGYFIQPTVFSDVNENMKIMKEEIFGPVASIAKFKTEEDAIRIGNNTTYGLASAVHTTNLKTAINVSNKLKAGTVWINQYNMLHHQIPFGGYRESGIGRELGKHALENYTQTKTVSIRLGGPLF